MASSEGTVTFLSLLTEVYNPRAVIPHAALLRQAFAHCGRFSTAASRRSLGSVSVPVWVTILSDHLPVIALVGHYPANELMGREPIPERKNFRAGTMQFPSASGINPRFHGLSRTRGQVTHVLLTLAPLSSRPKARITFDLHA